MKALTRKQRILDLLLANKGRRVPSPELAKISLQYGSRVLELRSEGYIIRNEIERRNGDVHGFFVLVSEPDPITICSPAAATQDPALFTEGHQTASLSLDYETGRTR